MARQRLKPLSPKELMEFNGDGRTVEYQFNHPVLEPKVGTTKNKGIIINSPTYYGIEIEAQLLPADKVPRLLKPYIINYITSTWKDDIKFIPKWDRSVQPGIELVSNPITLSSWARNEFQLRKLCALLDEYFKTTYKCGLHIHISKNGFISYHHSMRFYNLLLHENFTELVSQRRRKKQIAMYCNIDTSRWILKNVHPALVDLEFSKEKYRAIRITQDTCEIRIFRGTTDYTEILGNIQLLDILRMYTIDPEREQNIETIYEWAKVRQEKWLRQSWKYGILRLGNIIKKYRKMVKACAS